ncbi:FK506-binding protein 2 [Octopus bimaculoides]|uniref:peptidylprolyl isomerase n=1 Tax=Octopus bimaculoides TaxID=37653 RepID=A0A0L8GER2_OCTBM|nr:FK506-binding protein 2 [Octopus bimaculoides]XP_052822787.1 FK506-binding protein 2 [Octopus bimaculoides]|eukprot:XP_014781656.1 PREDICTED: FK506-binding protein 2-like [Octopus bimaculoides]
MKRLLQNIILPLAFLCFLVTLCYCEEKEEPLEDVKIEILKESENCERKVKRGDKLKVNYKGYLENGKIFDDSTKQKDPFEFQIDGGTMIKGWQLGLKGACVGETRKLTIPPKYAFGEYGNPAGIPGNSIVTFDIEIVSIEDGPEIPDTFSLIDANNDKRLSKEEVQIFFREQDKTSGASNHFESANLMFIYEDIDKDGYISHFEFNGPKHVEL